MVITWLDLEEKSVAEIQQLTGWSASLVKVRAFRARAEMKKLLARLSRERPWDAPVWYRLAEARGRSGDARGMHRAQGEYALLMGQIDDAQRQLEYARALSQGNYGESASVDERLGQIRRLRKQLGMATR